MFEKEVVFQSMRGRPSGSQLREHFTKMDMKEIVNECIGRECVVVYMYPEKISGNYQKDVLYHGILTEVTDDRICLRDLKLGKIGRMSRSRCQRFEFFLRRG
jgi:hypothetical protein